MKNKLLFLVVLLSISLTALPVSASNAKVAPYYGELNTNYQLYGDAYGFDFFSSGHATRFMQSGTLTYMKFNMQNVENLTEVKLRIWTKNEATGRYNLKSTSVNLLPYITEGANNISFASIPVTINVTEGDSFGIYLKGSSDWLHTNLAVMDSSDARHASVRWARDISNTEYDWENQTSFNVGISTEFYMDSPDVVFLGDSIMSGFPLSDAFTLQTLTMSPNADRTKQIAYKLNLLNGWTYQNAGISGDYYPNLYNRLAVDVIAKHPTYAVLEGGVNNLPGDPTAEMLFPNIRNEILDCQAAGITPIVLLIFPYGGLTESQSIECNEYNQMIIDYKNTNPNFIVVDCREGLGHLSGNTWALDEAYTADNLHLSEAGNAVVAQAIYDAQREYVSGPVAAFTSNVTSGVTPLTVAFEDQTTRTPTSWLWDFGDGQTSTLQNPVHVYSASGVYTVSLTVTNANGNSIETKSNYMHVMSLPGTSFTWGRPEEFTYAFIDQTTNLPAVWLWDFGDGSTSTDQDPVHTYAEYGNYTVSLTTTNTAGTNSTTRTLNIAEIPKNIIFPVGETWQHVDFNQSVEFSYSTPYGVLMSHWFIDGNEVNYTGMNLSYTFANPGRASNISVWAETTEGNSSMLEYRVMTGREVATEHVVPFNDTNYNNLMNSTLEMDTDGILSSIFAPLTDSMGRMAYVILFVLPFVYMWLQTGKMTIVTTLSLITGALFIGFIPSQFVTFISIAIVLSFASAFYKLSRGP